MWIRQRVHNLRLKIPMPLQLVDVAHLFRYNIVQRTLILGVIYAYSMSAVAIEMSDFVPSFLTSNSPNVESSVTAPVRPLVNVNRNNHADTTWYCTRMQNGVSNVFCNKGNATESGVKFANVSDDSTESGVKFANVSSDRTAVVDNSVNTGNDLLQDMAKRNASLQDQKVMNYLVKQQNQIQDAASLPIQTGKNVKMNINAQQVQFNIQY